jgi:hypothetical protein
MKGAKPRLSFAEVLRFTPAASWSSTTSIADKAIGHNRVWTHARVLRALWRMESQQRVNFMTRGSKLFWKKREAGK